MESPLPGSRKIADFRAVIWAGLIAGLAFLLVNMALSLLVLDTPWVFIRMVGAIVLGTEVLPPPADFDLAVFTAAFALHMIFSLIFTAILALIVHRWGVVEAIVIGALFGLAIYAINFYTFSYFFPWFYPLRNWMIVASHIVFGATAGGIYEALEVDLYEPVES
jgi:hypothetical protein